MIQKTFLETIQKAFSDSAYELTGIIPVPMHMDHLVRIKTLQSILEDFEQNSEGGTIEYLIQVSPKKIFNHKKKENVKNQKIENIYLHNGKLNFTYLIKNADILLNSGEYLLAKKIYKMLLRTGDSMGVLQQRLGKCSELSGRIDEAVLHYEDAIIHNPTLEIYQKLASIYFKQNQYQRSADTLSRALNLKGLDVQTRFELHKACANAWVRLKNSDEAIRQFHAALQLQPTADDVQSNIGVMHLQSGYYSEAVHAFQTAIAMNPKNASAIAGLGSCYLAQSDKKTAHDLFVRSLEIELNNPSAIFFLVKCAYDLKTYSMAACLLEKYTKIAPAHAHLLYSLAGLYFHLGRMNDAKQTALKVLELHEEHSGATQLLQQLEPYQIVN